MCILTIAYWLQGTRWLKEIVFISPAKTEETEVTQHNVMNIRQIKTETEKDGLAEDLRKELFKQNKADL